LIAEKHGVTGFGELGDCGEEGIIGYTGAGTSKQGQTIDDKGLSSHCHLNKIMLLPQLLSTLFTHACPFAEHFNARY